jgi:hypothetical protein
LLDGRFLFERRRQDRFWLVSDTKSELCFADLGEETLSTIYAVKKAVISRYLELESQRKTDTRQQKRRILSWKEKVGQTRKSKIPLAS